jgi:hypothetical protein
MSRGLGGKGQLAAEYHAGAGAAALAAAGGLGMMGGFGDQSQKAGGVGVALHLGPLLVAVTVHRYRGPYCGHGLQGDKITLRTYRM